jgi:hypothetical protein
MSRQHDVIVEEANPPPSEEHLALRLPETEPALVARVQAIVAAGEGDLAIEVLPWPASEPPS